MKSNFITQLIALQFIMLAPLSIQAEVSQQRLLDSLKKQLATGRLTDSVKFNILDKLAYQYSLINPDSGYLYSIQAVELATSNGWEKESGTAHTVLGINLSSQGKYTRAVQEYKKAIRIFESINDTVSQAAVYTNLSSIYRAQGLYADALEEAFHALTIYEEAGDSLRLSMVLGNIGSIYLEQKRYDEALEYSRKALEFVKLLENKAGEARVLGNLGIIYEASGNPEVSIEFHEAALALNQQLGNIRSILNNLTNLGNVYTVAGAFQKAIGYQNEAVAISKKHGHPDYLAFNLGNRGETRYRLAQVTGSGEFLQAIADLKQAVKMCQEMGLQGPLIEFSQDLSEVYAAAEMHAEAYAMMRLHSRQKDSVFSASNEARISNLETARELALKEKELVAENAKLRIADISARNERNERIIYTIGSMLVVLILILIIRNLRLRVTQQKSKLDNIAFIQSHKVRGPVARIQGLATLLNREDFSDPQNEQVINYIYESSRELDEVVKNLVLHSTSKNQG